MPRSGQCRFCRCTDLRACEQGCEWVDAAHTVCSSAPCLAKYAGQLTADLKHVLNLLKARIA